ncbi:excinuclease ABC subunit UvrB [Candidatus Pacearchaeota archaeon]|nr:excinuclease ABC subunit UvrB [Candidatus Pacearchaeota archaeon]
MNGLEPAGDQPKAIKSIVDGINQNKNFQTLMGVTGSGKTFTIANVIEKIGKRTLVLVHNKTLAIQLYNELKELFPENRVEYFVSFYDYYQPESYLPAKDQYIEKDSSINTMIERLRLSTTTSLVSRDDVIVVASVSCIYGLGNPINYTGASHDFKKGEEINRKEIISKLLSMQYERNDVELIYSRFRVKGETIDIIPGSMKNIIRIEMSGNKIERIIEIDKANGNMIYDYDHYMIFPARHFITPKDHMEKAIMEIKNELSTRLPQLNDIEAHRLKQRTSYDIEMMEEIGYCKGIENYSRHLDGRAQGEKPYCLLDWFGNDFLMIIDESHQSIPQVRAMYEGDKARKVNLVDYGFRLPSALDNRPLKFKEFEDYYGKAKVVFVSATPSYYEKEKSSKLVEMVIRPTGLVDPEIEVRKIDGQMDELEKEISKIVKRRERVLVTALTKKLAEEISDNFAARGIKARYLHSEIKTLERGEIIRELRIGKFDVLVGINLLREGLDIPEVSLVAILDADKEGFLRDQRSLIQIIGRAARNAKSKVIMFADNMTESMQGAIEETARRRELQIEYNKKHNITPKTIIRKIEEQKFIIKDTKHIPKKEMEKMIPQLEKEMKESADNLDFEYAISLRDKITQFKKEIVSRN